MESLRPVSEHWCPDDEVLTEIHSGSVTQSIMGYQFISRLGNWLSCQTKRLKFPLRFKSHKNNSTAQEFVCVQEVFFLIYFFTIKNHFVFCFKGKSRLFLIAKTLSPFVSNKKTTIYFSIKYLAFPSCESFIHKRLQIKK